MSTEIVTTGGEIVTRQAQAISVETVLDRLKQIHELMQRAMVKDIDYGIIPGTGSKPTLLKPGAEKLCVMFRLSPQYRTQKTFHDDGHLTVESTCRILDYQEVFLGEASAMASTRESKYAWRRSERVCPKCGKQAIIKGKAEYGGGWLCFKKKDGCGAKFADNNTEITSQEIGRVPNPDLYDSYNTVLRIAEKRSLLGAVRLVTGSSSIFDEEIPAQTERDVDPEPARPAKPAEPVIPAAVTMALEEYKKRLDADPSLDKINGQLLADIKAIKDLKVQRNVWPYVRDRLEREGYRFDEATKQFCFKAEDCGTTQPDDGNDIPDIPF